MQLEPTADEARRLVVTLTAFWAITGLASLATMALVPLGLLCGFGFHWTAFSIAGREADRPPSSFLFAGVASKTWREDRKLQRTVMRRIMDPRWWHRTAIPPTGWSRPAVEVVLLLTLASGLVAIGLGFAQAS